MADIWRESGWYDCCSGYWFLQYEKDRVGDEEVIYLNSESDIEMYYLLTEVYSLEYGTKEYYDKYDEIIEDDEESIPSNETKLKIKNMFEVVYDETIDHNQSWTCNDDFDWKKPITSKN